MRRQSVDASTDALEWWQVGKQTRIPVREEELAPRAPKPLFRRKIRTSLQLGVAECQSARPCADFHTVSLRFGVDAESCANVGSPTSRVLSHPVRCSGKLAVAGAVVFLCDLVSTTQVLRPSALHT